MGKHYTTWSCSRQEVGVGQHGISVANSRQTGHVYAFLFCHHLHGIPSVSKIAKWLRGLQNVINAAIQALSNILAKYLCLQRPAIFVGQILNFNGALG